MANLLAYVLFVLAGIVCCFNFYLSFLRYPLCKLLGREYKWESGIPVFGSLTMLWAVSMLVDSPILFWFGIAIGLLDTGGLHWFVGTMAWIYMFHRDKM